MAEEEQYYMCEHRSKWQKKSNIICVDNVVSGRREVY